MTNSPAAYPDTSDIIARKAEGRRDLAALTFGEKIARMEALRERLAPLRDARSVRVARPGLSLESAVKPLPS